METSDRLQEIAANINAGKPPNALTVREFLTWFGAQRRGYTIVTSIRQALEKAKLRTEPDFESAYIDSTILFTPATEAPGGDFKEAANQPPPTGIPLTASPPIAPPSYADPTYRVSKLAAANKAPLRVAPDATVQQAVTLMLKNDYSQLPVMTSDREVKGVISWASIGARMALGKSGTTARELMDPHQEIRADSSLFQAIPIIVAHQYVLIRGPDVRITGVVTASDLSLQFEQLAEPFLLLGEIENHIRRILGDKFSAEDLKAVRNPEDSEREINAASDLTFGEYIRLLEDPDRWSQLALSIDRRTFCHELDRVRKIRNDVMHFDPDGVPPEQLESLRAFTRFLQRLQSMEVT